MTDSAADTKTESRNIVTIEDKGPALKEITIEIPYEVIAEKLDESLATFTGEAQVPGFRKGRVPRRLIERKFGKDIREETKGQLIASAYSEAVEEHSLRVLGEPDSEELADLKIVDGQPLKFSVKVEILPEFDLPDTEAIEIVRPVSEITDEMVEKEVSNFCLYRGTLEPIEGELEDGAYLTGHGVMKLADDDEVMLDLPGAVVRIPLPEDEGKGAILGIMVDDFAKQIGRPKVGEEATITCDGPKSHEDERIRDKKLVITFASEKAERVIPAPVEELLTQYGMEDEGQLREQLRLQLERRLENEQAHAMRAQVAKHLLDNVEFDLPENITANQAARNIERLRLDMMHRGVPGEEIEAKIAEARGSSEDTARRELKLLFIIERSAQEHEVSVSEAEVNGRIGQLAAQRGVRPEQLRQELVKSGQISAFAQQIREHKVLDQVVAGAKVTDMPVEEYNEKVAPTLGG